MIFKRSGCLLEWIQYNYFSDYDKTSLTRISEAAVCGPTRIAWSQILLVKMEIACVFPIIFGRTKGKQYESVLEISFQQQKLTHRHNCCNIGLYWYKNISHRAAETVINFNHNLIPSATCTNFIYNKFTLAAPSSKLIFAPSGVQCVYLITHTFALGAGIVCVARACHACIYIKTCWLLELLTAAKKLWICRFTL